MAYSFDYEQSVHIINVTKKHTNSASRFATWNSGQLNPVTLAEN